MATDTLSITGKLLITGIFGVLILGVFLFINYLHSVIRQRNINYNIRYYGKARNSTVPHILFAFVIGYILAAILIYTIVSSLLPAIIRFFNEYIYQKPTGNKEDTDRIYENREKRIRTMFGFLFFILFISLLYYAWNVAFAGDIIIHSNNVNQKKAIEMDALYESLSKVTGSFAFLCIVMIIWIAYLIRGFFQKS